MNLIETLPKIKPFGKDENGKYSGKLYNLLNKISKNKHSNQIKIWFNTKSRWDGSNIEFHKDIHREQGIRRQIVVDEYGQMTSGYFLSETLEKGSPTRFSLCTFSHSQLIDVTDWFFSTYVQIGRCMFDKDHHDFNNHYNNRYHIVNKNHRKCRWCGKHFHRECRKVIEVKKYEVWKESNKKETVKA